MASLVSSRFLQIRPVVSSLRRINTKLLPLLSARFAIYPANVKCNLLDTVNSRSLKTWAEDRKMLKLEDIEARVLKVCRKHDKIDPSKVSEMSDGFCSLFIKLIVCLICSLLWTNTLWKT